MKELLRNAIDGIKRHPQSFLYDRDVQRAFRGLQKDWDDVLSVTVPISTLNDLSKLKLLPLPTEVTDKIEFPWFPMEHDIGTVAMEFVDQLLRALNGLKTAPTPTQEEVKRLKEKYSPDTRIKILHMLDDFGSAPGTVDIVDFVDDIGQIHLRGTTLALIHGADEF